MSLVFLNALSGTAAYLRQRRVDLALGWRFALATLPGAVGGAYVTRSLSSRTFGQAFGGVADRGGHPPVLRSMRPARPRGRGRGRSSTPRRDPSYRVDAWKGVVVSPCGDR